MKPFTELMELILSPLKSAAAQGAQNLASGIGTTVQLGLTLYIILYGWQVARGEIAEPWNEFAKRAVKLGLIVALIQGTGLYQEVVVDFLAGSLPDSLSNALSNKPIPDASAFDSPRQPGRDPAHPGLAGHGLERAGRNRTRRGGDAARHAVPVVRADRRLRRDAVGQSRDVLRRHAWTAVHRAGDV